MCKHLSGISSPSLRSCRQNVLQEYSHFTPNCTLLFPFSSWWELRPPSVHCSDGFLVQASFHSKILLPLKGLFTIFSLSFKSHILDSNVPCAASRGPLRRRESRSLGTKWKPKNVEFWPFKDSSGQNQLYHTPLLSKIWDLNDREKIVNNPFKGTLHGRDF